MEEQQRPLDYALDSVMPWDEPETTTSEYPVSDEDAIETVEYKEYEEPYVICLIDSSFFIDVGENQSIDSAKMNAELEGLMTNLLELTGESEGNGPAGETDKDDPDEKWISDGGDATYNKMQDEIIKMRKERKQRWK